jgi:hypothetical protein
MSIEPNKNEFSLVLSLEELDTVRMSNSSLLRILERIKEMRSIENGSESRNDRKLQEKINLLFQINLKILLLYEEIKGKEADERVRRNKELWGF